MFHFIVNDWYSRVKHAGQYMVIKNGIDELGGDADSALVPGGVLDPFVSMSKACPREDLKHKIYMESDIEKKKLIDLVCSHPIFRDSGVASGFKQVPSLRYALDNAALELDNDSLFEEEGDDSGETIYILDTPCSICLYPKSQSESLIYLFILVYT